MLTKSVYENSTIFINFDPGIGIGKGTVCVEEKAGTIRELGPLIKLRSDRDCSNLPVYHIAGLGAGKIVCLNEENTFALAHFYRDDSIKGLGPDHVRSIAIENLRTWEQAELPAGSSRYCSHKTQDGLCGHIITNEGCPVHGC
jgi:hypothetical protein